MNQKFFDAEEDLQDVVTTQDKSKAKDIGDMLFVHEVNEVVKENQNEQLNDAALADKGQGFKLPALPPPQIDPKTGKEIESKIDEAKAKFAAKDLEYPKIELIVCKKGKLHPDKNVKNADGSADVLAYLDGTEGEEPSLTLRIPHMQKGKYYILYRPDFKPRHMVRRLNVVAYSEFMAKKSPEEVAEYEQE